MRDPDTAPPERETAAPGASPRSTPSRAAGGERHRDRHPRTTPADYPAGIRNTNARKIARHSSSSPTRVGPATVIDSRSCLCGARKRNGYSHANQHTTTSDHEIDPHSSNPHDTCRLPCHAPLRHRGRRRERLTAWLALCAGVYWAMRQPSGAFGRIVARTPMPLMMASPSKRCGPAPARGAVKPGDPAPDFRLPTLDHIRRAALVIPRHRPVVLVFGSYT